MPQREITTKSGYEQLEKVLAAYPRGSWFRIYDRPLGFTDGDWSHRWYSTGRAAGNGSVYGFLRSSSLWRPGLFHQPHLGDHAPQCRLDRPGKILVSAPYPLPLRFLNPRTYSCREPRAGRARLWRMYERWDESGRPPAAFGEN